MLIPLTIGAPEIIIIAVVILLLVGGKKIPELMRGLGKGVSSFKKGLKDEDASEKKGDTKNEEDKK